MADFAKQDIWSGEEFFGEYLTLKETGAKNP